jgi:hypothetical protein
MIRDQHIYELNIDLDIDYITNLVMKKQDESVKGRPSHHRFVKDDPYMTSILERYPLLSPVYNIYPLPAHIGIPLHIDTDRSCAFNIPIKGTEGTHTIFYESEGPIKMEYDTNRIYDLIKSPVKEIFRYTLIRPVLINNSIPHEVTNNKDSMRITLSWSLQKGVTFEQAIDLFKDYMI